MPGDGGLSIVKGKEEKREGGGGTTKLLVIHISFHPVSSITYTYPPPVEEEGLEIEGRGSI